ncbi:MAG: DUF4340 domain-containing protein, partial [Bacteroidetes bacterium]
RSFRTELIRIDTSRVSSVTVTPKGQEEFTLVRESEGWLATRGDLTVKALPSAVNDLLRQLALVETQRIAAKKPEKWSEFEVGEGQGTRLVVKSNGKVLEDFIIGRFAFNQQTRSATSYVRLSGEDEVYAVEGFLGLSLGQGFDSYRNKLVLKFQREDLKEIALSGDENARMSRTDGNWQLDDGTPVDSLALTRYLTPLQTLSGSEFADSFNPDTAPPPLKTLQLVTQTGDTLRVDAYRDTTLAKPFVVHSSLNPEGWFLSDSTGLFKRLFLPEPKPWLPPTR